MRLRELFTKAPSVEVRTVAVLSADMENLFVRVKVDGVSNLVCVGDLVRSYQKVAHADNYMRAAKPARPQAPTKWDGVGVAY